MFGLVSIIIILLILVGALVIYFVKVVLIPKKLNAIEREIETGHYDNAIRALKQILANNNLDYSAHGLLAKAYDKTGNNQMAVVEYRIALRNARNEPLKIEKEMRQRLADILLVMNNYEDSLNEYVLLIKIDPQNPEASFKIGQIYYKLKKFDSAVRYLQQAIKNDPSLHKAHFLLGTLLFDMSRFKDSLFAFTNCLKFDPKNWEAHFYMARIYKSIKDFGRAMESFEIATRDDRLRTTSILEKGLCSLEIGNMDKAKEEFERGIKGSSGNDQILLNLRYYLAHCYEEERNYTQAIEQWERIEAVKPDFRDIQQKLAAYADLRQDDHLKDFMTASPGDFQSICYAILISNGINVNDIRAEKNGIISAVGIEADAAKWRSSKPMTRIVKFRRENITIEVEEIRLFVDEMKQSNCQRAMYFHVGKFSRPARDFAETRPVDLYGTDKIQELLKNAYRADGKLKTDEDVREK